MRITGKQIVEAIAKRLEEENVRCYDNAIVAKLGSLTPSEVAELMTFGEVRQWHNDRIVGAETK